MSHQIEPVIEVIEYLSLYVTGSNMDMLRRCKARVLHLKLYFPDNDWKDENKTKRAVKKLGELGLNDNLHSSILKI